jgi:hypoxanthine phosphoribosyltransferase
MKNVYLTDEQVRKYVLKVFIRMYQDKFNPDIIIGLARGGLVPGVYLSHLLGIPFKALNKDELFQNSKFEYPNALIIDDINDTGRTLADFNSKYSDLFDMVRYAVIVNNESSSFDVDYYGCRYNKLEENDWFVFPWEKLY